MFLVRKLKNLFLCFWNVCLFWTFFCGLLWRIHLRNWNVMRLGFWRTLQSSKVLNTVFTTSVLVVIFLHSLSISSLEICLSLARPATQKLTRVTITSRGLYQPEPSKFLNFQKNQNFEKKWQKVKSSSRDIKFWENLLFPYVGSLYRFYRSSYHYAVSCRVSDRDCKRWLISLGCGCDMVVIQYL